MSRPGFEHGALEGVEGGPIAQAGGVADKDLVKIEKVVDVCRGKALEDVARKGGVSTSGAERSDCHNNSQ